MYNKATSLYNCPSILTPSDVLTKLKTVYLPDWRRFCKFDAQKAAKRANIIKFIP